MQVQLWTCGDQITKHVFEIITIIIWNFDYNEFDIHNRTCIGTQKKNSQNNFNCNKSWLIHLYCRNIRGSNTPKRNQTVKHYILYFYKLSNMKSVQMYYNRATPKHN